MQMSSKFISVMITIERGLPATPVDAEEKNQNIPEAPSTHVVSSEDNPLTSPNAGKFYHSDHLHPDSSSNTEMSTDK